MCRGRCYSSYTEKYAATFTDQFVCPSSLERDVVIVGGGHNGLVTAAYLAKRGLDVLVLERRHIVGGAAVTEEIVPGFKFSRASYLAGLLRNSIIEDLELETKYGFEYIPRPFSSFTPTRLDGHHKGKSLIMGQDADATWNSIAQFSERDADAFVEYEQFLDEIREIVEPLLEGAPPNPLGAEMNYRDRWNHFKNSSKLVRVGMKHRSSLVSLYELVTGSATQILDRWFESDVLKTTLACDAVIGAMISPSQSGSAYVLLHHVMGEAAGRKGMLNISLSLSLSLSLPTHPPLTTTQVYGHMFEEEWGKSRKVLHVLLEMRVRKSYVTLE